MKTSPYIKLTAIGLASLLTACSSSPEITRVQVSSSSGRSDGSLADRIHRDVNAYRSSKGKASIERHSGLDAIAQKHCDYLVSKIGNGGLTSNSINHHGFEGRALVARHAYRISTIGENVVASTNNSSKHLVDLWANSKSHNHNMRSKWTYTGVGTATTASGLVVSTQVFGTAEDSVHSEIENRFNRVW